MIRIIRIFAVSSLVLTLLSGTESLTGQSVYTTILKADALNKAGHPDEALKLIGQELQSKPDSRLYLLRAESFIASGDYASALNDYKSANDMKAGSGNYGLARIAAIKGDATGAVKYLEADMRSTARKSEKAIMLDPAFSKIENSPEWRQFWKKDWYTGKENYLSQVRYYLSAGNRSEASKTLILMNQDYPGDKLTVFAGALISYDSGKNDDAVKALSELISSEPGNPEFLGLLAGIQQSMSNYAGAINTLSGMIALEIPDATLFLKRAECYIKTGELKNASSDVESYLSVYPDDVAALRMSGRIKAASGDNLGAIESYSKNIKLHPGVAECFNDRGNAYFASKTWDWAVKDYTMSLDLDPGNPDVWLNKGIALINTGKTDDACSDFRRSFSLGSKKATEYISKYCIK